MKIAPYCPAAIILPLLLAASVTRATESSEQLFASRVHGVLAEKCFACHGDEPKKIKGELNLLTLAGALRGGESGRAAIVAGQPEESPLFLSATRTHADWEAMPPKDNDALTPQQTAWLKDWIATGAAWPDEAKRKAIAASADQGSNEDGVKVRTSGGLGEQWTERRYVEADLWAYKPLAKVSVPQNGRAHPVDAFLAAKWPADAQPATRADARALIRRATLDLTGLPPNPQVPFDYEKLPPEEQRAQWPEIIAGLLASPRYAEQQARRWLDVVRYADTAGFANDFDSPNAWRYRDYVVRSFQRDTPYDRFIKEQLAGDELAPGDPEAQLATGFLRAGPWEHTVMSVEAETRQQWLDDAVNITGNAFLGMELSCFKCHDHKFDPLPTRDYYRLQAVFASAQLADLQLPFLPVENTARFSERHSSAEKTAALLKDYKGVGGRSKSAQKRIDRWVKTYEPVAMGVFSGAPFSYGSEKVFNHAPSAEKRGGELMTVSILGGGSLHAPGEAVTPGVLSAPMLFAGESVELPTAAGGRRLALAEWIASERNPFTARVIVNRVWAWHFNGRALVATPNGFGVKGAKPTHPELLDWLARWFMDEGWSLKKLHALILTSDAWQRSAVTPATLPDVDARIASYLLFPTRRITAEELRDAMLWASGELNLEMGGTPARIQMNWDAAVTRNIVMGQPDLEYRPDPTPTMRNRRSVYAMVMRSRRDPLMEVFDQPGSERSCAGRDESIIVPQAFTLMNSDFTNDRALALANRLWKDKPDLPGRFTRLHRLLYGRGPTAEQLAGCRTFYAAALEHHQQTPPAATKWQEYLKQAGIKGEDLVTKYQPDLQPADVPPPVRALADLCLVMFNTAEFLHLP